ncbi:MAG: DUF3127 domain-containing protein [Bacteroidales bacterium]|nr:DUF3127 domain-containing protein [Bacteroidales bacterium]MBD5206161.1 DUF3127 domain-containing protein [Bacteroidales bacterium]MBD5223535.1 DUF3127 domain-containing protein [Bacteroidales bacterium]MBD5302509.1 DUF3127 domain-containing protein [Bacteroides sp.]
MDIEGKIIKDLGIQEGISKANNPWKKQEWVMETMGNYPKQIKFTVFGERRIEEMKLAVGEVYRVSVDVESREYQGRYYTDVNAFGAVRLDGSMPPVAPAAPSAPNQTSPAFGSPMPNQGIGIDPFAGGDSNTDDLPF